MINSKINNPGTPRPVSRFSTLDVRVGPAGGEMVGAGELEWGAPPTQVLLEPGIVHFWCIELDLTTLWNEALEATLSEEETIRASRYHFVRDRRRFIARRGVLRTLLGLYTSNDPRDLRISCGLNGKPRLQGLDNNLHFNLSHSDGVALYAFRLGDEIGVDIEKIRTIPDVRELAAIALPECDRSYVDQLSGDEQSEAFLWSWAAMEAKSKASGQGIGGLAARIPESTGLSDSMQNLSGDNDWFVHQFSPVPGYIAAVAGKLESVVASAGSESLLEVLV